MLHVFLLMIAVAVSAIPAAASSINLIQNGSFEPTTYDPPPFTGGWKNLYAGSTMIPGWTVATGNIDWKHTYWTPQDGEYSIDLSGGAAGGIRQAFAAPLRPGMMYQLTFWMSGNPVKFRAPKPLTVRFGVTDAFLNAREATYSYDTRFYDPVTAPEGRGNSVTDMKWELVTWTFTAREAYTTMGFFSLVSNSYGPALDTVSLAAVPEPGLPLLFATLLAIVPLARRFLR